jgi:hypothetical protein
MDLLFARSFQPALMLGMVGVVLLLIALGVLLAGAGPDDLLVGPFRWQLTDAKLV